MFYLSFFPLPKLVAVVVVVGVEEKEWVGFGLGKDLRCEELKSHPATPNVTSKSN